MLKKLTDNQKTWLIIGIVLLILVTVGLILLWRSARNKGRKEGSISISTTPTDPGTGNTAAVSEAEINTLASQLHSDMEGLNMNGHDDALWGRWMILSDTDFIRVSNRFNEEYQKSTGQTMREWVASEGSFGWGYGSTWRVLRDNVIARMEKLNIQ